MVPGSCSRQATSKREEEEAKNQNLPADPSLGSCTKHQHPGEPITPCFPPPLSLYLSLWGCVCLSLLCCYASLSLSLSVYASLSLSLWVWVWVWVWVCLPFVLQCLSLSLSVGVGVSPLCAAMPLSLCGCGCVSPLCCNASLSLSLLSHLLPPFLTPFKGSKCISRESNPGHIDGNDVFYH